MNLFRRGGIYYCRFFVHGREKKRSTHCRTIKQAQKVADALAREIVLGRFAPQWERLPFSDMKAALIRDYRSNERRSIKSLLSQLKHLDSYFGSYRASQITKDLIARYVDHRLNEKASHAMINREMANLSAMFRIADIPKPRIPHLRENNARQGFVKWADFKRIRDALPAELRGLSTVLYVTGWRFSSVTHLQWRNVTEDSIRVPAEHSKNNQALEFPLNSILREAIYGGSHTRINDSLPISQLQRRGAIRGVQHVQQSSGKLLSPSREDLRSSTVETRKTISPYVFHHNGKPWKEYNARGPWKAACKRAGFEGLLIHDLCRSAVRNMVRTQGITEHMAMALCGRKTRSILDRYDIISVQDRQMAAEKLEQYLEQSGPGKVRTIK